MKNFIYLQMLDLKKEMRTEMKDRVAVLKKEIDKIVSQNLLIPDLVGPEGTGCKNDSLSTYILDLEQRMGGSDAAFKEKFDFFFDQTASPKIN